MLLLLRGEYENGRHVKVGNLTFVKAGIEISRSHSVRVQQINAIKGRREQVAFPDISCFRLSSPHLLRLEDVKRAPKAIFLSRVFGPLVVFSVSQ